LIVLRTAERHGIDAIDWLARYAGPRPVLHAKPQAHQLDIELARPFIEGRSATTRGV
jgi:hypothetical protein